MNKLQEEPAATAKNSCRLFGFSLTEGMEASRCPIVEERVLPKGPLGGSCTNICMLKTKLVSAESMTHDVIRDLLGVKLDMTKYANLINQKQLQKLIEDAARQTHGQSLFSDGHGT